VIRTHSWIPLTGSQVLIGSVVGFKLSHILLVLIIAREEGKEGTALIIVDLIIQLINSFVRKEELFYRRTGYISIPLIRIITR
jgi:hypothetical protein